MKLMPVPITLIDPETGQKIENYLPEGLEANKLYRAVRTKKNGLGILVKTDRMPDRWVNMSWFREA